MVFTRSLTDREKEALLRMQEFVKKQHAHSDSHDYSHVFSVLRFSIQIGEAIDDPVDPFVVVASALLHDIGKTSHTFAHFHGLFGGSIAEEYLDGLDLVENETRDLICRVIVRHTPTSGIPPDTSEEKIVYDADTLDRLGLMGLLRGFIGKQGSMKEILTKYMSRRSQDYEKLHFEISKEIGVWMQQELEGFAMLVSKRLEDRMKSLEDLLKPVLEVEEKKVVVSKGKKKARKKKK